MKKLTRNQRAEVYIKVAEKFSLPKHADGLCYALLDAIKHNGASWDAPPIFPEFALFEPNKKLDGHYWFENNKQRIIVMLLCHQMCINP